MATKRRKNKSAKPSNPPAKKPKTEPESKSNESEASSPTSAPEEILKYLLLDSTLDSISPPEILEPGCAKELRYPHSDLPPFCSLVSALLLSKPFSHRLGMRAIHQLLNDPYNFTTPKSVLEAGGDARWQALMDAHTLHKDKTSGQLRDLAQLIKDEHPEDYDNSDLKQLHDKAGGSAEKLSEEVCKIKGFAAKTTSLFFRRVQLQWEELFPYADQLALDAAKDVGLQVNDAQELLTLLQEHLGDKVEGESLRRQFVRLLDVLIGKKLDKDVDQVKEQAAELSHGDHEEGAAETKVHKDEVDNKDTTES